MIGLRAERCSGQVRQALGLLADGEPVSVIAEEMDVAVSAVKGWLLDAQQQLGVYRWPPLVLAAYEKGLLDLPPLRDRILLAPKSQQLLGLSVKGLHSWEIAERREEPHPAACRDIRQLWALLGARDSTHMVKKAVQHRLVTISEGRPRW